MGIELIAAGGSSPLQLATSFDERREELQEEENSRKNSSSERSSPGYIKEIWEEKLPCPESFKTLEAQDFATSSEGSCINIIQ